MVTTEGILAVLGVLIALKGLLLLIWPIGMKKFAMGVMKTKSSMRIWGVVALIIGLAILWYLYY